MSFLGKKFDSAIEILIIISSKNSELPISSRDIACRTTLSLRYVEMLVKDLVNAELIKSIRGARGGYNLAKERRNMNLCNIFDAVHSDGINNSVNYFDTYANSKSILEEINNKSLNEIKSFLSEITFEEIYNKFQKDNANRKTSKKKSSDFVI